MTSALTSATPPRVLVVGQTPPPWHGSAVMTTTLRDVLTDAGVSVAVVSRDFSDDIADVGRLSATKVLRAPRFLLRLVRAAVRRRPGAVVLFLTTRPLPFLSDVLAVLLFAVLRVPVVLYVHTVGFTTMTQVRPALGPLVRRVLDRARGLVLLGAFQGPDVAAFSGRAWTTIPNCVTPPSPAARADEHTAPTVVFFSNWIPGKGVSDFVDIAALIHRTLPAVDFRIAGHPSDLLDEAAVAELAATRAPGVRLDVVGAVHGDEKWRFLEGADLLVFPSTYDQEAQPLSLIEALATGTAVVGYAVGGVAEVVEGTGGSAVRPGDVDGAAEACVALLASPEELRRVQAAGVRRHRERYSADAFGAAWLQELREAGLAL